MEQLHLHQVQPPQSPTTTTTTDVHSTPVANATPTHPHLTSNHPSYAEMITAAILWDSSQGKAGGSSKRSIAKYIDRVYTNLPPTHSALLTHHLKRLKNTGQLVMIKSSYQLPVVAAAAATAANTSADTAAATATATSPLPIRSAPPLTDPTPKKRPGRPSKPKSQPLIQPASPTNGPSLSSGKRPRGRPPRDQKPVVAEVPFVQTQAQPNYAPDLGFGLNDNGSPLTSQSSVKRRRGRPSKSQSRAQAQAQSQSPAQAQLQLVAVPVNGTVSEKKRPGRPPKAKVANGVGQVSNGGPKSRGRSKRNVLGPVSKPIGKKPRGRPPRQSGVPTPGKRRGRPPKGSLIPLPKAAMRKLFSDKPRGRPKKSASTLGKPTHEKRMAKKELIKKVENMQAKIRDAVGMLKPYFPNENATDEALAALQLLEDISIMDITAPPPPNLPVEPPVTTMPMNNVIIQSGPSELVIDPAPSVTTIPAPQAAPPPPVMPFSISAPAVTESAPFYIPPNVGTEQPTSWGAEF